MLVGADLGTDFLNWTSVEGALSGVSGGMLSLEIF